MRRLRMFRLISKYPPSSFLNVRDVFVIWARCKWDDQVRGFLIEKVGTRTCFSIVLELTFHVGHERPSGASYKEQACAALFYHGVDLHG